MGFFEGIDFSPIIISLKTAVFSIVITFFSGIACAKLVNDAKSNKVKMISDVILTLPLVLPPTVAGFFLLYVFGAKRPVGILIYNLFKHKIVFSWGATVVASVLISFPLMYRACRAAFEQIDKDYVNVAKTLGLGKFEIFRRIEIPLAMPGIISGTVLAFTRGLGEFGATAMIAGNIVGRTRTLPLAIYSEVSASNMDIAGKYVIIILAISIFVIGVMNIINFSKVRW